MLCTLTYSYAMYVAEVLICTNYAMRLIIKQPPRTSSQYCLQLLNWMDLYQQRCLFVAYQIHKCVLKLAPAYLSSKFSPIQLLAMTVLEVGISFIWFVQRLILAGTRYSLKVYNCTTGSIRVIKNLAAFRCVCVAYFLVK